MGDALQVGGTPVETFGALRLARTEQTNASADGGRAIGHIERLRAGLSGDRDLQLGTTVQLFGQVNDQPGLAGARR